MRKRKLLFSLLALGLGAFLGGSRAMAQNGWESVYNQTQTTSANWIGLTTGSTVEGKTVHATAGMTLGTGSTTTPSYYYLMERLDLTNSTAGGSGLTISGTVYLYIPNGLSISCQGANASGKIGAGAGIELASGNTLYIIGGAGTVTATGGNAANGSDGGNGTNATGDNGSHIWTGAGGNGGNGGGGAGAGIGTRGGAGGNGGSGGSNQYHTTDSEINGTNGSAGNNGSTAGAMGALYVENGITVNATGGSAASSGGAGGERGRGYVYDGYTYNDSAAGGGGGGGGGFGGAASSIGTGGPGGGGGGGGAGGSQDWRSNSSGGVYNVIANGGSGGTNADGTAADNGATAIASEYYTVEGGSMGKDDWHGQSSAVFSGNGGSGGNQGNGTTASTNGTGTKTYKITFRSTKTDLSGVTGLTHDSNDTYYLTYSPGTPNIVLPKNEEGYNWVLKVYGKSCAPDGTPDSEFATATTAYYGGNYTEESYRTILLNHVYGDLVFQEVATMLIMECSTSGESANNDQEIEEFYDYGYNVTTRLQNRTLYRDNHWNTICLPFAMTPAQIANSPLAGATIKKMNQTRSGYYAIKQNYESIGFDHPVVLFWFDTVESTESLVAGKPYLVKWTEPYEHSDDGNYVDNTAKGGSRHELDFPGVTITATQPGAWTGSATVSGDVTFQGTFSLSADLSATDADGNMNLVLGANDKLYHPSETMNAGACRGYFKIPEAAVSAAPQFVMGFDDDETTGIQTIDITPEGWNNAPAIYNLSGQRLNSLQKGVNIVNGKKVVVK